MELTVLGTAAAYPRSGVACSGYLVESGSDRLLVDLGAGALTNLPARNDPADLSAVLVSHLHPDHYSDIFTLSIYLELFSRRAGPMPLFAPPGTAESIGEYPWTSRNTFETVFDITPWDPAKTQEIGRFRIRSAPANHSQPTFALDIEDPAGARVTYTADTGPSEEVEKLARRTGLLLAEASWEETPAQSKVGHMTAEEAGAMAAAAGAGQLVLTHLLPEVDPKRARTLAARRFQGPVAVAEIGRTYEAGS